MDTSSEGSDSKSGAAGSQCTSHGANDELSFGIELEFLVYYKKPAWQLEHEEAEGIAPDPDEITLDPEEEKLFSEAITLPNDVEDNGYLKWKWFHDRIEEIILTVPGARLEHRRMPADTPEALRSMYVVQGDFEENSGWRVKDDTSVSDPGIRIRGYECVSMEVNSPALWDRPESHRHVQRVVRELTRNFRLRISVRTGFHVHVGAGVNEPGESQSDTSSDQEGSSAAAGTSSSSGSQSYRSEAQGRKHPLGVMKRAVALMWAADGFLCHAHPPERGFNQFTPPVRFCSQIAHGIKVFYRENPKGKKPLRYEGLMDDADPRGFADALRDQDLPSRAFPRRDGGRFFGALRPEAMDDEAARRLGKTGYDILARDEIVNRTVYSGVEHIMQCKNRAELAHLFATASKTCCYPRANYNLRNYLRGAYNMSTINSGTVEFREATGSLHAEWITVWTNICLGIFRFARSASEARFRAVIARLAEAEEAAAAAAAEAAAASAAEAQDGDDNDNDQDNKGKQKQPPSSSPHDYDMISLLIDMGLFAEALFLERKLREDPMRFWYPNLIGEPPCWSSKTGGGSADGDWRSGSPGSMRCEPAVDREDDGGKPSALSSPFVWSPAGYGAGGKEETSGQAYGDGMAMEDDNYEEGK
ncbi:3189b46f-da26-4b17-94ae-44d10e26ed74 [Thermothielavioides terrestris]|uniref:3189b46f-da26-4b17-94ae-44d10e26ed74 n=1 Tax=Thermothielavioides terrestris TaxID=2587410 RepID=A0A3S4AJ74_9PEZI|nr:3189b46f-da26-4b17-94ae-44d10e26ed74 [Thermothielavioides terrestris]